MSDEKMKDYYYSQKAEDDQMATDGNELANVWLTDNWYVYTEMVDHGKTPVAYDDLVKLGSTIGSSQIFIGYKPEAKRKVIEYVDRECDGYCQWCTRNCRVKTIKIV